MITRQRKKSAFRRLWMPLVALGFLGYFGYHAFSGSFGIWAMDRLEADAARLTADRDRSKPEREALERHVATSSVESRCRRDRPRSAQCA